MKIVKAIWYIKISLAITIFAASGICASGISISAEVTGTSMTFEGKDTLIVRLEWEGEPFQYLIDDFPMPNLEKLEIVGSSSSVATRSDSSVAAGQITARTYRYILSATDFGTGVVEPLNITATNRITDEKPLLQTGRLTIEIAKPVPKEEAGGLGVGTVVVIAIIVVIAAVVVIFLFMRRKREEPEVDPVKIYISTLDEIKKETVADGKLFYSRLYRLLLQYLEKTRGMNLSGQTGEEVLQAVEKIDDEADRDRLAGWLDKALKIKFRPEMPSPADIEDSHKAVKQFFESKLQSK